MIHPERTKVSLAFAMCGDVVHPLDVVCTRCHSDEGEACTEFVKPYPWFRDEAGLGADLEETYHEGWRER